MVNGLKMKMEILKFPNCTLILMENDWEHTLYPRTTQFSLSNWVWKSVFHGSSHFHLSIKMGLVKKSQRSDNNTPWHCWHRVHNLASQNTCACERWVNGAAVDLWVWWQEQRGREKRWVLYSEGVRNQCQNFYEYRQLKQSKASSSLALWSSWGVKCGSGVGVSYFILVRVTIASENLCIYVDLSRIDECMFIFL